MSQYAGAIHNALRKKANKEATQQFVMAIEDKVRQQAYDSAKEEAMTYWQDKIDRGLARQMELVMLLKLRDLFGFGAQRCADAIVGFEELWGDIGDKRLSLEDIEDTVREELGLLIEDEGVFKIDRKGNRTQLYPKEG